MARLNKNDVISALERFNELTKLDYRLGLLSKGDFRLTDSDGKFPYGSKIRGLREMYEFIISLIDNYWYLDSLIRENLVEQAIISRDLKDLKEI